MKTLFVAEQFVPPVNDGSTAVYHSWLKTLKSVGEVYAILFTMEGEPNAETHSFLSQTCRDYLILPGRAGAPAVKIARAIGRFVNGSLFASPLIEELGRNRIKTTISKFIAAHKPDVALVSKVECVHLIGLDVLTKLRIPKIMDLHDDYVMREKLTRRVLRDTLREFPALTNESYYNLKRLRYWLFRYDYERARSQECRILRLFDRVMIASYEEYLDYSMNEEIGDRCVHVPWPIEVDIRPLERAGAPEFDAGLIAGSNEFNLEGMAFLVKEVMPLIRKRRPNFRLLVAGTIADTYPKTGLPTEGLILAGLVKDVSEFYARIKICLVPLLNGTGMSLKTLEGLRYGLPVVATKVGARGLGGQSLPNLRIADTPHDFAETVLSLLNNRPDDVGDVSHAGGASKDQWKRFIQICREFGIND